jgi:trehalose 6-phosphate phosphatase
MPVPEASTDAGRAGLDALLASPHRAVLGIDFDGTLAPIVDRPDEARPLPHAVAVLGRLAPHLAGVAVITGRPAAQVIEFAQLRDAPGLDRLVVLGQYGRERAVAPDFQVKAPAVPPGVDAVRRALPALLAEASPGTTVEDKGAALVVHARQTADPAATLDALRPQLADLALAHGLFVEPARLALELRPPGFDKGQALRGVVTEAGASTVMFVGDDLGDLPAYAAVEELRLTGAVGLLVAAGSAEVTALRDRADLVVDGPPGVLALLESIAERLG